MLYHRDNDFNFESRIFKIADIQERHKVFLNKYFDIILAKLKKILDDYLLEIDKLENVVKKRDFKTVLKLVELYFEAIFESDYNYDKASLIKIYSRKNEHIRYANLIDRFYNDLETSLFEKRKFANDIFERKIIDISSSENSQQPKTKITFSKPTDNQIDRNSLKVTYHYEIGKIASRRNPMDFNFFGGLLKVKCQNNKLVLDELEHMELNIYDKIEYYSSLRLICTELNEE